MEDCLHTVQCISSIFVALQASCLTVVGHSIAAVCAFYVSLYWVYTAPCIFCLLYRLNSYDCPTDLLTCRTRTATLFTHAHRER